MVYHMIMVTCGTPVYSFAQLSLFVVAVVAFVELAFFIVF
jgi:hypothetical protein